MVREAVTNGDAKPARATNLSLGAAIVAFANAAMQLVVSFGVPVTTAQAASIGVVVNSLVLLVIAGSHVYGQVTAERERWSHLDPPGD
jgi:hypothetical protein